MKERPILFSDPMVNAILDGKKTQTRRAINKVAGFGNVLYFKEYEKPGYDFQFLDNCGLYHHLKHDEILEKCPYGKPGDRLYVREAARCFSLRDDLETQRRTLRVEYRAGGVESFHSNISDGHNWFPLSHRKKDGDLIWSPSMFMPRWASRITLEITGVRVEQLNDISEKDAWAEGCIGYDDDVTGGQGGYGEFAELWESINGSGSWDENPGVWVIEFRKLEAT